MTAVKRSYQSSRRDEAALATRRSILAAATELFLHQGYGATTIDQIAARAGVSRPTVFATGSKAQLLKLARDVAMAGDDDDDVTSRDRFQRMLAEPDAGTSLDLFAEHVAGLLGRYAELDQVVRSASGTDPEVYALWQSSEDQRLKAARLVAANLAGKATLSVPRREAAEVLWLLMAPDVYHRLVVVRRWSTRRYSRWLASTLRDQLLG